MNKAYVYAKPNGEIYRHTTSQEPEEGAIEVPSDLGVEPFDCYLKDGEITPKGPKPGLYYVFNYTTGAWELDLNSAEGAALAKRDQLLREGPDRINPLWWASMTADQQQAWTQYRQLLLDVTEQPGFPLEIIWPTKPE